MRDSSAVTAAPIRQRMLRLLIYALIGYILVLVSVRGSIQLPDGTSRRQQPEIRHSIVDQQ